MSEREYHPYQEFLPQNARAMIIGSFPIGKFTDPTRRDEIKPHEFDFPFGGEKNLLWKLIGDVHGVRFQNTKELQEFLTQKQIAIGDVIKSCRRIDGGASDSDLKDIEWNQELLSVINRHHILTLLFTSKQVRKWFNKLFPEHGLTEILLHSPSAQSARSIVRLPEYKTWKENNPDGRTYQFLLNEYKGTFNRVKNLN
jgi:G:T/U-mismatch repair DNA glycosylase